LVQIYLDIDGVILTKDSKVPEYAVEFIQFLVSNFDCHWCTTHCRNGANRTIEYLTPYYDSKTIELLKQVKTTNWDTLKTEAIDLESKFIWLEDFPMQAEKQVLSSCGKLDSLVVVDLSMDQELQRVENLLLDFLTQ